MLSSLRKKLFGEPIRRVDPGCRSCARGRIFTTRRGETCFCLQEQRTREIVRDCEKYVFDRERFELLQSKAKIDEGRQS